jgi:hypothetical protein
MQLSRIQHDPRYFEQIFNKEFEFNVKIYNLGI